MKITFRLPNGAKADIDIAGGGKNVCIFPLTKSNKVVLAKQFRPGPQKVLNELPGGKVDLSESPRAAAGRELLEETGYKGDLVFIGKTFNSAYHKTIRYNFVAKNCIKVGDQKLDEHEFIEPTLMTLKEFRRHLRLGNLTDIATGYLALDYLKLL